MTTIDGPNRDQILLSKVQIKIKKDLSGSLVGQVGTAGGRFPTRDFAKLKEPLCDSRREVDT
jgi:hypothetical protein